VRWYARENDGVNQTKKAKRKRENSSRLFFAKRNTQVACQTHCNISLRLHIGVDASQGRSAKPSSTGRSDSVLQRQSPPFVFVSENVFTILIR
jgi:hypothetical protein